MELIWFRTAAMLCVGAFAGCLGGLTGVSGGLMVTPFLTLFFGVPIRYAIATSLCCGIAASCGAAARYAEQRLTDVRLGMTLELATTAGGVTGAVIAGHVGRETLAVLFAFLLIYGGASMVRQAFRPLVTLPDDPSSYQLKRLPLGLVGSSGGGIISGLLGVGEGVIKVPLMFLAMGVPFKVAAATSNFMVGITSATSALVYYARGDIMPLIVTPTAIGVFVGASVGTHVFRRIPSRTCVLLFSLITFCFAPMMLVKAFHGGYGH
jgi:hypothetical protein